MNLPLRFAVDATPGKPSRHLRSAGIEFQQKEEKTHEC